jgi:hypothetical protein
VPLGGTLHPMSEDPSTSRTLERAREPRRLGVPAYPAVSPVMSPTSAPTAASE